MRLHPRPAPLRSWQRSLGGHWSNLSSPCTSRARGRDLTGRSRPTITAAMLPHLARCSKACIRLHAWRPFLSPLRLWACRRRNATTFLPRCLSIPRLSNRYGMRPLCRGVTTSMAATHTLVAQCALLLPTPAPDGRRVNAQGERARAEAQPWEEGQCLYRQLSTSLRRFERCWPSGLKIDSKRD